MSTRLPALDGPIFGVDVQSGDVRGEAPSYALVVLEEVRERERGAGDATAAGTGSADGAPGGDGPAGDGPAGDGPGGDGPGGDGASGVGPAERVASVERDVVSRRKLLRLIEGREPAIVATDNVYELVEDRDALIRFLSALPHGTRLVQVTGGQDPEPLSRVAKRHNVPYDREPMAEAEASARLAAANVGVVVTAFTDTTEVRVSRGRSTGKGGWSEDRHTRRIHGAVKRRARAIADELEAAGLEYEREVTEKYGGFANATFAVEARPEDIPITTGRDGDVRVEMERVRRDGIEFRPLAKRRDHVVVGIDPGTTTAVAVVGLDGGVLDVWSSRTVDTAGVIEWIVERGRPVVVASDVTPMPETVEKIRRSFDAAGWTPASDLPVDEKLHRTREEAYENDHERDALAAALFAHDAHADQFERIAAQLPARVDRGEVTRRVVADEEPVQAVLEDLTDTSEADAVESDGPKPRELTAEERRIRDLEERVERLTEHVDRLEGRLAERDERIAELEAELETARREERREVRRDREVTRLERRIESLEDERDAARAEVTALEAKVERMKALWKLDHSNFSDVSAEKEGLVPVKVVEKFTRAALREADEAYGIARGDVVFLRDATGAGRDAAKLLAELEPRLVIRQGGLSDASDEVLFEHAVPVAPADSVAMQEVDELAVAREADVESAIDDWRARASDRERDRRAELVDRLISEHRASDRED